MHCTGNLTMHSESDLLSLLYTQVSSISLATRVKRCLNTPSASS